jgi:hypothetical protein
MYLTLYAIILISAGVLKADCVVFTKPDSADWTLEEYQDRITDNVWITRKHTQSIFNIAQEEGYSGSNGSPVGTLWANSTTAQADSASYSNFVTMHGGSTQSLIGDTVSLYLPDDNLYFDVLFTSFSGGNSGGGFSYIRISVNTLNLDQQQWPEEYTLSNNYPNPFNPVTTFTYQLPEASPVSLHVYDLNGKLVLDFNDGIRSAGRHEIILTATGLSSGTYFCVFSAGSFQTSKKVMLLK